MKTTRKIALFISLAFAFVVGCQGQYPEREITEIGQCRQVFETIDSAKVVMYHQPLDAGRRWGISNDFEVIPSDYVEIGRMTVYSSAPQDYQFLKRFAEGYRDKILNDDDYTCGYYRFAMIKRLEGKEMTLFYMFFIKCNPRYLGRND